MATEDTQTSGTYLEEINTKDEQILVNGQKKNIKSYNI